MNSARPLILLVDDVSTNLEILRAILSENHEVLVAASGEQALDLARSRHPDLVLLDILMPGMDGYEVCRILKGDPQTEDIPIVFLTSLEEIDDELRGLELGAIDFLSKPVSPVIVQARVRNIIRLRRQQRALEELAQGAERAKKAFLDHLNHELRTPLTPILGLTELMLDEPGNNDTHRHDLQVIQTCAGHLLLIFDLLLEISRLEVGALPAEEKPFDLQEMLSQLHTNFSAKTEGREVKLDLVLAPGLPKRMVGDPAVITKLLSVLLWNAFRFTEKGRVTLEAAIQGEGETACLTLSVRDTGRGISAERLAKLFQSFTQGRDGVCGTREDSGACLTLSRQLAKLLGGRITANSREGEGSVFSLEMPMRVDIPVGA